MNHHFMFKGRKVFAVLISILLIFSSCLIPVSADNLIGNSVSGIPPRFHSSNSSDKSIIVKYKDEKKSSFIKQAVSQKLSSYKINIKRNLGNIDIITASDNAEYEMVLHELKNNPYVEYAQPDYKLKRLEVTSGDLSSEQWSIANSGQSIMGQTGNSGIDINVRSVWDYEKGNESVIVGVLDSGMDISHPELKDSIYINQKEIPGNGIDDDQNGYIDDVSGWDFMNSDNTVYDNSIEDFHGTHVAGIIAAKHDNQGINGIVPDVKILPLKFLNQYDGFTSDAIEAIRYAKSMGVKVINCSFGDTFYNYALENEMRESGILFVCSSGNDGANLDTAPVYPAAFSIPNKITVAAVDNKGELCDFSNYGSSVDVAAPGKDIISTIPEGKFEYASGTSMAAPIVTGTAALLWSFNPSYGLSKVKENIIGNAKKLDSLTGKVGTGAMVNAFKASLSGILPYDNRVLTRTTDRINVDNFSSGAISEYNFNDMIPLVDGWVIIGDILKNKVLIVNVFSGDVSKEYQLKASPYRIDFNPDEGKIIVTQRSSNNIALIDVHTDEIKYIPISGSSIDVVFAKNNNAVVLITTGTGWPEKKISVLDWESGLEVTSYTGQSENYGYLACDRATNNILVGAQATSPSSLTQFAFNENTNALEKKGYIWDMGANGEELAISPDGLHAAFACGGGNGGGYTIFDIDATNINNKFGQWNTGAYPTSVAFSRDSKYIIATNGQSIQLFDVKTHELVEKVGDKSYTSRFSKVGISNGRKIAYARGENGKLYYYLISLPSTATEPPTEISTPTPTPTPISEETPELTATPTVLSTATPTTILNTSIPELTSTSDSIDVNNFSSGSISGYSFKDMIPVADGWVIIGDITKNKVFIINVLTGDVKKQYQLNAPPDKIDFNSEKGKIIATQRSSNNVVLIDPYTDEIKYIPISGSSIDVVFAKNNDAVVLTSTGTGAWGKKISILDWENGLELPSGLAQVNDYCYLACDRSTNNVLAGVAGTSPSTLSRFVLDEKTKELELKESSTNLGSNGQDLAISSDGLHAAFACGGGNGAGYTIFDIDATNINKKYGEWSTGAYPTSASFSKDSKYIIATNGFSIKLFSVRTHGLVSTIADKGYERGFTKVGISNGGKIAFAKGEDGKLYYYLITDASVAVPTPVVLNNTIKGKVYLPNNLTAQEDIHIEVYLQNGEEKVYSTPVVIKKGTNSQDYTLLSPSASTGDKLQVGYCISEGGQSYAKWGSYSSAGTTFDEDYAENLTVGGNLKGIDMELLVKRIISGKVSLPAGDVAPSGGIEVKLAAGYYAKPYYTDYVTITEGQNSSNFEIAAYANDSDNKYILWYSMEDTDGYISYGFYNGSGMTIKSNDAAPIDIRYNDVSNIQMAILYGRTISGTVRLPDNRTAPEGGIQVEIAVKNRDWSPYYSRMVKIEGGKNSVGYTITVPDRNNSYYVSYYSVESGYVRVGYYQGGNTAANSDNASIVNVYSKYVSGINLSLILGKTFKGKVSLPYGNIASKDGIRVIISAEDSSENQSINTGITIKEGQSSADYSLTVPIDNTSYYITYYTEENGYVKEAYSSNSTSTTVYLSQATIYDASANNEQTVSLQLIIGTDITGEISLSSGTAPSGGINVIIILVNSSEFIAAIQPVLIPGGNTKAAYTITAPRYQSFYVGYILPSDKSYGFYSDGQTVSYLDYAESIYVRSETITGKNMVIRTQAQPQVSDAGGNTGGNTGGSYIPLPETSDVNTSPTSTATVAATSTPTVTPEATPTTVAKPSNNTEEPVNNIPSSGNYKDIAGHWAEQYINTLLGLGIISGYEDSTIRPNKEISRAEAVVIICRSTGLKPAENIDLGFSDNKDIPDWARGYVQTVVDKGILKGYPDNTFKPDATITRAEVIALVMKAFGLGDSSKAVHMFSDDKAIASWSKNYIQKAFELGIITGYKDNTIRSGNNISRAEMFVIISKCLKIKN